MTLQSVSSLASRSRSPSRVLVLHAKIIWRHDEASEVWEHVTGMLEADNAGAVDIRLSDGRTVFSPVLDAHGMSLRPIGSLIGAWARGADVLHVHHVLPAFRHLIIAVLFRLRGSKIVLSPYSFLTDDFAARSWTHARPRVWTLSKPIALRILRSAWRSVPHAFVCSSRYEATSSRLPDMKCVLLPLARPDTPLLQGDPPPIESNRDRRNAPVLFVSRMDPWRKGIDRLCAWLLEYTSVGPRPSVVLLAPRGARTPAPIDDLTHTGSLKWDWQTRGADLEGQLRECRGLMLLSRFEGQPRSLREALWMGLPIICTPACNLNEVISVLGSGAIVSGDDPAEIQSAFESLPEYDGPAERARRLFDRKEIGRFLVSVLLDVGSGRRPTERDYYSEFLRSG